MFFYVRLKCCPLIDIHSNGHLVPRITENIGDPVKSPANPRPQPCNPHSGPKVLLINLIPSLVETLQVNIYINNVDTVNVCFGDKSTNAEQS